MMAAPRVFVTVTFPDAEARDASRIEHVTVTTEPPVWADPDSQIVIEAEPDGGSVQEDARYMLDRSDLPGYSERGDL